MFRSFAAKAIVPPALAVTGFVIVCCILLYSVIKTDMINDTIQHETNLTDTIIKSTRYAMLKSDRETLGNIINNVGEQSGVEHVRIFNKKGVIMFSARHDDINRLVDKNAAGCIVCHAGPVPATSMGRMEQARRFVNERGVNVLAITAPIYNEPDCSNAACHVHPAEQKLLGTLDIGLSEEPLNRTLATMRGRMVVFCLMVLILSIGGVSALLRRNVLIPIKELTEYVTALNRGESSRKPPHYTHEIGDLASAYQEMASKLTESGAHLKESNEPPRKNDPGGSTSVADRKKPRE